eukprot:4699210-Prymnesium_polylepis.1
MTIRQPAQPASSRQQSQFPHEGFKSPDGRGFNCPHSDILNSDRTLNLSAASCASELFWRNWCCPAEPIPTVQRPQGPPIRHSATDP